MLIGLGLLTGVTGCRELWYEPAVTGDVSPSQGEKLNTSFYYEKTVEPPFTTEDLNKTMPLSQLLNIALYNNPATRASWNAARAAAFGYHVSLSEEYPTINYFGNIQGQTSNGAASVAGAGGGAIFAGGSTNTAGTGTTTNTTSTTSSTQTKSNIVSVFNQVTLSYLFLDFGGRRAQEDLAFQILIQTNWQHNLTMQEVMISVLDNYTNYIGNKALVAASEQNVQDATVLLQAALKMHQNGVATQTDVLSAQSTLAQMRFNLEQAKGAEKTALGQLLIALGLPPETALCVQGLPEKLPVVDISGTICSLIELAKQRNPSIAAAIAAVKQQEANWMISYSSGMPTITINGSVNQVNFIRPKRPFIYNDSIAFEWNAPIFAGFFYVNQLKQIRAQIEEAVANLDVTVAQVESNVVTNYYAFKTAEAALPSSEAVLVFSQRAYRGMLTQYRVGTSSIQDVVTSLTTLSNARAQEAITKTQWAASLANLAFSVGILSSDSGTWKDNPPQELLQVQYKDEGQRKNP